MTSNLLIRSGYLVHPQRAQDNRLHDAQRHVQAFINPQSGIAWRLIVIVQVLSAARNHSPIQRLEPMVRNQRLEAIGRLLAGRAIIAPGAVLALRGNDAIDHVAGQFVVVTDGGDDGVGDNIERRSVPFVKPPAAQQLGAAKAERLDGHLGPTLVLWADAQRI